MNIGDKVKYENSFSDTMIGVIVSKEQPTCKCKGMGKWVIDFNGEIKKIKISDERLSLYNIEPTMTNLNFNFGK
jgi:hypothetical protein